MNISRICFSFSKLAAKWPAPKIQNQILKTMPDQNSDLIFIRHGESTFNVACESYRKKHKIPYIWKELCIHEGFDQKVLFNPTFMDCSLTETGKLECKKTHKILKNIDIDCVLVSPQLRTLQTCYQIFHDRNIPVFVQPLLTGPLRSCSDVNRSVFAKKKMFPKYIFDPTFSTQSLWCLQYLPEEQRKICYERFKMKNLESINEQRIELVKLLKEGKICEGALTYRKRIQELKNKIGSFKEKYHKIAIVSHYYTIEYLGAMQYEKCGTPKYYIDIKNCHPYYGSVADMLSYKLEEQAASQ